MKDFGFSRKETRVIEVDKCDTQLLNYVFQKEKSLLTCMYCGSCTASCSAGNLIDFNIRKIYSYLKYGEYRLLSKEIEKCMLCGKCTLVCPRDINLRYSIMLIKKGIVELNLDNK